MHPHALLAPYLLGPAQCSGLPPPCPPLLPQAAALMQRLLADVAYNRGVMPPSWNWPPVTAGQPAQTLVFAQNTSSGWPWPGGGVRAEADWRASQCGVLTAGGLAGQEFWWCD
jgi:hypothetical protein